MADYKSFWGDGPPGRLEAHLPDRTAEFPRPLFRDEVRDEDGTFPSPIPHEPKHQAPRRRWRWTLGVPWVVAALGVAVAAVSWLTNTSDTTMTYAPPTAEPAPPAVTATATVTATVRAAPRPAETRTEPVYVRMTVTARPAPAATVTATVTTTATKTVTAPAQAPEDVNQ